MALFCRIAFFLFTVLLALPASADAATGSPAGKREHLIFFKGTAQELEVFKIYGKEKGPTVMLLGGIQGDEPGGFLSADSYADASVRKGNLIVVPRANFRSVIMFDRGPAGDMNRKFADNLKNDPELQIVEVIKSLMAESDLFLNLHDGSGYYRPTWESDLANPRRYGQCVISDTDVYTHGPSGKRIDLAGPGKEVVRRVNQKISTPLHKFHFFNMYTIRPDTQHKEQRKSATYYALTELGIAAYGIEASKQLPTVEMKIYHHNLAINAFLDIYGVELEQPFLSTDKATLHYALININGTHPLAIAKGNSLTIAEGDSLKVEHVHCGRNRGISVKVEGTDTLNTLGKEMHLGKDSTITIRHDNNIIGRIPVKVRPKSEVPYPTVTGSSANWNSTPTAAVPSDLPGYGAMLAARNKGTTPVAVASTPTTPKTPATDTGTSSKGKVSGFSIAINGKKQSVKPGTEVSIMAGTKLGLIDLESSSPLPVGTVMNLKGYLPEQNKGKNTGEDRGHTADTGTEMMPAFSMDKKGLRYALNAEHGKKVLATCTIRITKPVLAYVTLSVDGKERKMPIGRLEGLNPNSNIILHSVTLKNGQTLEQPRYTLGGRPVPTNLPQKLDLSRNIALNLAIFNGNYLLGKVTLAPK